MKKIYVASRASIPARAEMWRTYRERGFPIISTWIDEAGVGETANFAELWSRIDREIANASCLIAYVEKNDFPLKGALIEIGMAIGRSIPVYIAMPDVVLEPGSLRPVGSWLTHPLVMPCSSLDRAFQAAGFNGSWG